jgi:uncharacterized protein (DUF362 family)
MPTRFSRRALLQFTAAAPVLRPLFAQPSPAPPAKSTVALMRGENRRQNIAAALTAIDDRIRPVLRTKKSVVIKVNNVSTVNQLAATHADALHGILDYLGPRFRGPVYISEASAGDTLQGFDNFGYNQVASDRRSQHVELIDLNREAKYKSVAMMDYDLHAKPARFAARLFDPDAYIFCAAMLKTHNVMVATLSVKNMALGAPLHSPPGEKRWDDKRVVHNGLRQTHYNVFLAAQVLKPFWGAAVIDGYEGMEGNGPASGTPVASRIAIASTDFIAADRVAVETMGINPDWLGYLRFCSDFGIGCYDPAGIEIRGEKIEAVRRKYMLHRDIERELEWMGPMTDLPRKLG